MRALCIAQLSMAIRSMPVCKEVLLGVAARFAGSDTRVQETKSERHARCVRMDGCSGDAEDSFDFQIIFLLSPETPKFPGSR